MTNDYKKYHQMVGASKSLKKTLKWIKKRHGIYVEPSGSLRKDLKRAIRAMADRQ